MISIDVVNSSVSIKIKQPQIEMEIDVLHSKQQTWKISSSEFGMANVIEFRNIRHEEFEFYKIIIFSP